MTQPGGCEIGLRPIDLHLKGLRALQVQINETRGEIHCDGTHARGAEITLEVSLKEDEMAVLDKMLSVDGVMDASLISYEGEFGL